MRKEYDFSKARCASPHRFLRSHPATNLEGQGIDRNLARRCRESYWLEPIGRASYRRVGDRVDWKGAVYALQNHAGLSIWPGGLTALSLAGFAHYLPMVDLSSGKFGSFVIKLSSLERATFELLYLVPRQISFEHAAEVVQALLNLRPGVMQMYLESCRSIKVKRLLLFLATYYQHPWVKHIELDSVDLGAGKRQIVKSGCLDKHFQITVPSEFADGP